MKNIKLVLLRHGQSLWNKQKRFTGWTDIGLSEEGKEEAAAAGEILKKNGFIFDLALTSTLKRAVETLTIVLKKMNHPVIPIKQSFRLNEKHYGDLQGKSKLKMIKKYGENQVHLWRRGYDVRPPALKKPVNGEPLTESLKDVFKRVLAYWQEEIVSELKLGKRILISAHGNSLRALIKYLDKVSDENISKINIPTGLPLVYEFSSDLKPVKHYYLGDPKKVTQAMSAEVNQLKKK